MFNQEHIEKMLSDVEEELRDIKNEQETLDQNDLNDEIKREKRLKLAILEGMFKGMKAGLHKKQMEFVEEK